MESSVLLSLTEARSLFLRTHKWKSRNLCTDPHGHFNSSLISLTKGTFTLIAGKIADTGNMTVATPVGTLRIRDIAPRIEILKDGSVKFSTLVQEK